LKLTEIDFLFPLSHRDEKGLTVVLSRYIDLKILSQTQALKTTRIASLPPLTPGEAGLTGLFAEVHRPESPEPNSGSENHEDRLPSPLTPRRKRTDRVALSRYIDLKILSQTQALKTMKIGSLPPLPPGGEGWGE